MRTQLEYPVAASEGASCHIAQALSDFHAKGSREVVWHTLYHTAYIRQRYIEQCIVSGLRVTFAFALLASASVGAFAVRVFAGLVDEDLNG